MKIERINENQIRCTLNHSDLADRQIELSELAYGSEKARQLFHEMIQTAAAEIGFEIENAPIMVEAIPLSLDTIMLIVTRVDDPDELDTRFSRFSPSSEDFWDDTENLSELASGLLEGAGITEKLISQSAPSDSDLDVHTENAPEQNNLSVAFRLFSFSTLDQVAAAAAAVSNVILVHSTLYKNTANGLYYLCIHCGDNEDAFRRTCNSLSEYGTLRRNCAGALAYCEEHCETIIANRALDKLARLA